MWTVWGAETFGCDSSVPSGDGLQSKTAGQGLYQFWGDAIYKELYKEQDLILNLASEEYAKTVRKYLDGPDRFVDVEFLTMRNGKAPDHRGMGQDGQRSDDPPYCKEQDRPAGGYQRV